jgi:hypothetical protein
MTINASRQVCLEAFFASRVARGAFVAEMAGREKQVSGH